MWLQVIVLLASASGINIACNPNDCPPISVNFNQRGDTSCNLNCMTSYCDFDSQELKNSPNNYLNSDCTKACLASTSWKCKTAKLGNGVCDNSCNTPACGYDFGDCGYCAPSCNLYLGFQQQLGGSCDLECNTTSCYYDYGACLDCAIGCNSTVLGDGTCNQECNNKKCGFDNGDCLNTSCAPNCFFWMINNSICDEACHVQECNYDGTDCDCSPGCFSELLENDECDEICNNSLCEWDGGDCGYCASGCFLDMLINNVCDAACNNFACKYDYYVCKCNDGCLAEDYGKCKPECLTVDCIYDQVSPDPSKRCNNKDLVLYTLYQQAIYNDPRHLVYFDNCSSVSSNKCSLQMSINQTKCYSECNFLECNYGLCNLTSNCYSMPTDAWSLCHIWRSSGWYFENKSNSLISNIYFLGQVLSYDSEYKKSNLPDFWIFYATSTQAGISPSGEGSYFLPFETLDYAFSSILNLQAEVNVLILANDGNYTLTQNWDWQRYNIKKFTLMPLEKDKVIIRINGWTQLSLEVGANSTFKNLIFDGSGQFNNCNDSVYCEYCSYSTYNETDGFYYSDRNQPISQNLPVDICSKQDSSLSLFSLNGQAFILKNVEIKNFRFNYDSIIAGNGILKLYNVNFDNIRLSGKEKSAVIYAQSQYDFEISYIGGSLTRLNNGYEFGDSLDFSGFLYVETEASILIKNVKFKYNLVYKKSKISLSSGSLIYIDLIKQIEIENCTFMYNYCENGLFYINLDISEYTADYNETLYLKTLLLNNIYIHDSQFTSNYGNFGLVYISFLGMLLNIYLDNLTFESNGADNGSLIYIYNAQILDEYKAETVRTIDISSTKTVSVILSPRWCNIFNIYFKNNYATGMLNTINLVYFYLYNLTIDSSGSPNNDKNIKTLLLDYFIENRQIEDLYISRPKMHPKILDCDFMVSLTDSYNFSIYNLSLSNNVCRNSSPNFQIYNSGINEITKISCFNNTGNGPLPICLYIAGNLDRNLSNSIFIKNTNYFVSGYGAVQIKSENNFHVKNCSFEENSASLAPAIYAMCQNIYILNSTFESNESKQGNGGTLHFISATSTIRRSVTIESSSFWNNYAYANGGGVYLEEKSAITGGIELKIIGASFVGNSATYGSGLFIDQSAALSQDSIISSSIFQENSSSKSGAIFLQYYRGIILIQNSEFVENTSVLSAVLHIDIAEDTENLNSKVKIEFSTFRGNKGKSIIYGDNQNRNSSIETKNCLFEYNKGIVVYLDFDYFSETGSIFQYNSAPIASCFYLQNSAVLYASSIFLNNTSEKYGGVISITFKSIFYCDHCTFTKNQALKAKGGVLVSEQDSQFSISNSQFIQNSCGTDGSAIFVFNCNSTASSIAHIDFLNNHAYGSGLISLISSQISISSINISSNSAEIQTSGIKLAHSIVNIYDSVFENQASISGNFIYAIAGSYGFIKNTTFYKGNSSENGGAIYSSSSTLLIESSSFSQLFSRIGGAIYCAFGSSASISNCDFFELENSTDLGIINANQATLSVQNSRIHQFSATAIYGNQLKKLEIENSVFSNGLGSNGGAVWCESCSKVSIRSSVFENNTAATYGGALYFTTTSRVKAVHEISTSTFKSNTAQNGGAIYSDDIDLDVLLSLFILNKAISSQDSDSNIEFGKGGGILVSCSTYQSCKLNIKSNNFTENTAKYNGGAISWDYKLPNFANNSYLNNSAEYGDEIASFPAKLMRINIDGILEGYKNNTGSADPISISNLTEIAPGQNIKSPLLIALVDQSNSIIQTDNWSTAELIAINSTTQISGKIKVTSVKGIFNFSEFSISEEPGSDIQIMVTSIAIDTDKLKNSGEDFFSKNLVFNGNIRKCEIGEIKTGKNCEICPEGFYSLNPSLMACNACPETAICYGNWTMVPRPGYWRDNKYTEKFWECPYPSACLGSPNKTHISYTGECSKGYKGNKCQSCKKGYTHTFIISVKSVQAQQSIYWY
ncbi:unnamed protein product [Blepharisma stoltei]|uniref:LNR domain-containing protein n=1 Tax=Blepharisma stoltei TaxID=1481888 RepID=A0AAU9ICE0_9CILI|nr:unnamed protein product [Blepharisma stoltei]